ncbi:collagenase [Paenibacillus sp. MER TA 81-3]|uniref:collagenase n=1 Tax=Paenibacillus sp. MER TA 81-3 TaxID=2939573 RepID=UPI0020412FDC|nr:collagenase [Paenibacillus sp. MER TA 81-3]MCM3338056.1 collagenase [Paenibacillus sp. MER TA 81-3]
MKQKVWTRLAAALLAVTVAAGSPAGFAAAKPVGTAEEPHGFIQSGSGSLWSMTEDERLGSPLGAVGELPSADSAEAGMEEPKQAQALKSEARQDVQSTYSMAHLSSLSNEELTDLLAGIEWRTIPELFKYNEDTRRFYADEDRFQAIVDRLEESGRRFTAEDDQGIPTLVEVLRSGYYLGYYNEKLGHINEAAYREKVLPAVKAITENPAFAWGTPVQNEVIGATGKLISNTTVERDIVNRLAGVLATFVDQTDAYDGDPSVGEAFYSLIQGVGYVLMWRMDDPVQEAAFKGGIDAYLEQLFRMVKEGPRSADKLWLMNNAIYYTGSLGHFYSDPLQANRVLTEIMQTEPALSEVYFVAADQIAQRYAGMDANGSLVDMTALKQQGKERYLPQRTEFDDGRFIFQTGNKLSEEQIQRLYWAAKEVQAQFHRVIGSDKALEPGNADDVLTVVIYNNPDEYRMNRYLYGYETENGGIYIEGDGTFFTYDRTIEQSIYSLEELFRHEFTHYLQGRYVVPGMWGRGPLYDGGRMQWFDEGGAEFFAGATRTEGIQPRKSVVGNLRHDGPEQRFSVSDTVNAQYGTWKFYDYSFALYDHLYRHNFAALDRIHDAIQFNDAGSYEGHLAAMSGDAGLNQLYQRSIEEQVAQYDRLTVPLVSDDYMRTPEPKPMRDIYGEIASMAGLSNVSTQERESRFFQTFELRGTYIGGAAAGETQDWQTMNGLADEFLKELTARSWDGYKTVTAYFTNYRMDGEGRFVYDLVFHGKLPADRDSVENPDGDGNGGDGGDPNGGHDGNGQPNVEREPNDTWEQAIRLIAGQSVSGKLEDTDRVDIFRFDVEKAGDWMLELETAQAQGAAWVLYHESDLTNYAAYPSRVADASVAGSVAALPGTYYVYVYATALGEQPYRMLVQPGTLPEQQPEPENPLFEESEPNDSPDTANGPIPTGRTVIGALEGDDDKDMFVVDVDKPSALRIELEKRLGESVNWMLFREGDTDHPVSYPIELDDKRMSAGYEAEPGRYYVLVYKYADEDVHYTLQIR